MSLPVIEKLILRQINHWNSLRQYLQDPAEATRPGRRPVLTISRSAGSGGRLLAEDLCNRLSLELQDQSMVQRIVKDRKLEESLIGDLDENTISQARLWIKGVLSQKIFMREQYHHDLVRIVSSLAARGGVLFLGRGANLILAERADLRIRVVATQRTRISNLRERFELSRAEARMLVEQTDAQRAEFVKKVFRQEPGLGENYDLTMNSERLSNESMTALVIQTLFERGVLSSQQAMHGMG